MIKPARIESKDGKEFLKAFDEGTRSTYESGLGVFLAYYREMYGADRSLEVFLDELEEDLHRPRRERKRVGRRVLQEFAKWMGDHGFKPKSIRTYVSSVQALTKYYDIPLSARYANLPSSQPVSQKFPWTTEEVAKFIALLPTTEIQSLAVSAFQSGLGPADLLGVTFGDVKREYEEGITPLCFDFARQKTDVPFMTFIGTWGVTMLRKHLKERSPGFTDKIYTIPDRSIRHYFREAGRRWLKDFKKYPGFNPCRFYTLRSAFRTILGDAGLQETYIEFFMGHKVVEQRRVYVSKSREGWRETYRKYELALTPKG